jgi:hypothetical protein
MRDRVARRAALVVVLCLARQAKADDPCLPAQTTGNPLTDPATLLNQQQRFQDCLSLRQAQWAAYNAHQKSLLDTQGKVGGTVLWGAGRIRPEGPPKPPNPPALAGNSPQAALQMMVGILGSFGEPRGVYANDRKPRPPHPYAPW